MNIQEKETLLDKPNSLGSIKARLKAPSPLFFNRLAVLCGTLAVLATTVLSIPTTINAMGYHYAWQPWVVTACACGITAGAVGVFIAQTTVNWTKLKSNQPSTDSDGTGKDQQ